MSYFRTISSSSSSSSAADFLNIIDEDTQLPSQTNNEKSLQKNPFSSQFLFTTQDLQKDEKSTQGSFFQTQFNGNSQENFSKENRGLFNDDIIGMKKMREKISSSDDGSSSLGNEVSQFFPDTRSFTSACRSRISIGQQIFNSTLNSEKFTTQEDKIFTQHLVHPSSYQISQNSQQYLSQATTSSSASVKKSNHQKIPQSIFNLYNEVKEEFSDWVFVHVLVGQLCFEKFPMGAYQNLKLALIMSLVTSHESPMHIMAIGREAANADTIMRKMGELAERFMPITNSTAEGLIIKKNGICEAGSLVMASRGVAFIGYWQQLKPKNIIQLLREIETNTLLIQRAQKHVPMESTVWAHWNSSKKVKKDIATLDQFLSVFGIPIMFDDKLYEDEIVLDLLDQLSECPKDKFIGFKISEEDIKAFVNSVRNQKITFDHDAETMLKKYYSATKIIRKHALTIKGVEMLRKMSEAHAKLSLRVNVMRQDVLAAIAICERFIKTLFDTDAYSSPIEPKIVTIDEIDMFQSKLFEWFSCFTEDILEKN